MLCLLRSAAELQRQFETVQQKHSNAERNASFSEGVEEIFKFCLSVAEMHNAAAPFLVPKEILSLTFSQALKLTCFSAQSALHNRPSVFATTQPLPGSDTSLQRAEQIFCSLSQFVRKMNVRLSTPVLMVAWCRSVLYGDVNGALHQLGLDHLTKTKVNGPKGHGKGPTVTSRSTPRGGLSKDSNNDMDGMQTLWNNVPEGLAFAAHLLAVHTHRCNESSFEHALRYADSAVAAARAEKDSPIGWKSAQGSQSLIVCLIVRALVRKTAGSTTHWVEDIHEAIKADDTAEEFMHLTSAFELTLHEPQFVKLFEKYAPRMYLSWAGCYFDHDPATMLGEEGQPVEEYVMHVDRSATASVVVAAPPTGNSKERTLVHPGPLFWFAFHKTFKAYLLETYQQDNGYRLIDPRIQQAFCLPNPSIVSSSLPTTRDKPRAKSIPVVHQPSKATA